MTQYNTLNVKFSNLQLNKNGIEVTSKLAWDINGDSNDENDFLHKLLLTNTQVLRLCKAFAKNSSANINLSKTRLHKIGQSGGLLGRHLGLLLKTGLLSMKNVLKPITKSVLILLELTAATSESDAAIHKKMFGPGTTKLIISNEEMNYIIKKSQITWRIWFIGKRVSETIKNETKEQKGGFLSILLGTLGASLLGSLLTDRATVRAGWDF